MFVPWHGRWGSVSGCRELLVGRMGPVVPAALCKIKIAGFLISAANQSALAMLRTLAVFGNGRAFQRVVLNVGRFHHWD